MQVKLEHVIDLDRSYASVNKNNINKDTRGFFFENIFHEIY